MSFIDGLNKIVTKYAPPNVKVDPFINGLDNIVNKFTPTAKPIPTGAPIKTPYLPAPNIQDNSTAGIIKNTISALPEQAVRGIGLGALLDIPKAYKDMKASGGSVGISDVASGLKDTGQGLAHLATDVITKPAVGAVELATGQKNLAPKLPILGTITSPQQDVEDMVNQGIPRWQAIAQVSANQAMSGGAFVEGAKHGVSGAEALKSRAIDTYNNTNPQAGFAKVPFTGNETPAEILKKAEEDAAQKHLKHDEQGKPIPYTAKEKALVGTKKVPFMPTDRSIAPPESRSTLPSPSDTSALPELPQESINQSRAPLDNHRVSSNNDTTNQVKFKITGDTEKQKVQSAITNSERAKNEISIRGKDAYVAGRDLSPSDMKLAESYEAGTTSIPELVKQAEDPVKFKKFMDKMTDYYDFRLAADRAAGGTTGFVESYIPHMWDLSNPGDLAKFNSLAMQKGLQPYDGFRSQPRVFGTYAEGEAAGFKRANPNIVEDLKNDYGAASSVISKQVLKQGLKQAALDKVTTKGFGRTEQGKPFVNSNIPGLEGLSYHPNIDGMLKGFEKLTNKDFIKMAQEEAKTSGKPGFKGTLKEIPKSAKEAGFTGIVGTLYDHASQPMKQLMLNFSGFHSINISANFAGASMAHPIKGLTGLIKSIPSFFSETMTKSIIDGYKAKKIPGTDMSVFDAGLRAGVNMDREIPAYGKQRLNVMKSLSRAMFDRELHTLKLNLVDQVFSDGKIDPESPKGRAYGKEINMIMGEMNNHTMNINPNTQKWLSRILLAPQFTESKYMVLGDAFKGREAAGNLARTAVVGKSIILGTLATLGTLLATGKFPNLKNLLLNYTIDPNIQTNLTNPKGQKQDIGLPKSFISEPASLITDPIHYGEARLAPGASDILAGVTNKDYYGNPIVDPNSKDSKTKQILENVVVGDLPIGAQNIIKQAQGKQTGVQTGINIAGLRTHISKDDPTAVYYKAISDAKSDIKDISGADPKRTEKIQEIYNILTPQQKKSLNYQLLLEGINTKGVLSGDAGKMKPLYDQLQVMKQSGQTEQANEIWSKLSPEDKVLYKKVKTYYKKSNTSQGEKDFEPTFQSIRALKTSGDPALESQADAQYNALNSDEKHYYQLLKKQNL